MFDYKEKVKMELQIWERKVFMKPRLINRISKKAQSKVNDIIPEKVHKTITESIKSMVKTTLLGSNITTSKLEIREANLEVCDANLTKKLLTYRKTAVLEGAGTGAGGILLGLADFPLLLTIKMKFLFEAANVYGFDTNDYEERLFILYVFKLAFSSGKKKQETFLIIKNWETQKHLHTDLDWHEFQQEYRDHIDLIKMFQLVPGFGAVVGAYANYNLLDHLGETAMNAYRLRRLYPNS